MTPEKELLNPCEVGAEIENEMPPREKLETIAKDTPEEVEKEEKEKAPEKLKSLEIIRKGLEATLARLESDPQEREGELLKGYTELIRRNFVLRDISDIVTDKGRKEAKEIFFKDIFSEWKKEFWETEREYAKIPQPKTAIEHAILWNSNQALLEGRIMDGFKQIGQLVTNKKEIDKEGILPLKKRTAEITVVDREKDKKLVELCDWARKLKNKVPDEEERFFVIAQEVFKKMGGRLENEENRGQIKKIEEERKEILLGDINYGMCRHRALLFHILAEETGIKSRAMKCLAETVEWLVPTIEAHQYHQAFLKNGEIMIVDTMFPPGGRDKKEFGKYFEELSYAEFKEKGGFPRFGSNRLPFRFYQDPKYLGRKLKGFQGGRLGADGLKELLKKK